MLVRLQKYLADCGVCARRKAEILITEGRVSVNGIVVTELGFKADEDIDIVTLDGEKIEKRAKFVYVLLNKPVGYVTTVKDQFGRADVTELVKDIDARLFPVGRLDYNTSGLLLMTNDGDFAYKMTHPKHDVKKVYIAKIKGVPTPVEIDNFKNGLYIESNGKKVMTAPANLEILSAEKNVSELKITLNEGRNRQVRKMIEAIGYNTVSLERIAVGNLALGDLESGEYRFFSREEVSL